MSSNKARPDYGLDAPGLVRAFFFTGFGALLLLSFPLFKLWPRHWLGALSVGVLIIIAAYTLGMGCFMVYYSRVSKLRERERLIDLLSLSGSERVLDVGCGRGLMLVGIAKRLPGGQAVGIDIWQQDDQSGNHPDAALGNARLEGVAERIEVETADMRQLPFPNHSFDAVVSHWAVHNLSDVNDRAAALAEIHRVLKPAGQVILADIEHQDEYVEGFFRLGFADARQVGASAKTAFLSAISFGSFCPTAVRARKPAIDELTS